MNNEEKPIEKWYMVAFVDMTFKVFYGKYEQLKGNCVIGETMLNMDKVKYISAFDSLEDAVDHIPA